MKESNPGFTRPSPELIERGFTPSKPVTEGNFASFCRSTPRTLLCDTAGALIDSLPFCKVAFSFFSWANLSCNSFASFAFCSSIIAIFSCSFFLDSCIAFMSSPQSWEEGFAISAAGGRGWGIELVGLGSIPERSGFGFSLSNPWSCVGACVDGKSFVDSAVAPSKP